MKVAVAREALQGIIVVTEGSRWKEAKSAHAIATEALSGL